VKLHVSYNAQKQTVPASLYGSSKIQVFLDTKLSKLINTGVSTVSGELAASTISIGLCKGDAVCFV